MTLTISAWARGEPQPLIAAQTARQSLHTLSILAEFQNYLKKPTHELPPERKVPSVVARARDAARAVGRGLTPMAAVAGAVADELADNATALGADKVLVNNGGDIAIRLAHGRSAQVGLRSFSENTPNEDQAAQRALLGRLNLKASDGIGGVATSGWGGRSFSLGLADAVSVWAGNSAIADAAATALGNAVSAEMKGITRQAANELDPSSDLGETLVTTSVPKMSLDERAEALAAGRGEALRLKEEQAIVGCLIVLQGDYAMLDGNRNLIPSQDFK